MNPHAKLIAELEALVAYCTDETGMTPQPAMSDIPGTMRRAADALRKYVSQSEPTEASRIVEELLSQCVNGPECGCIERRAAALIQCLCTPAETPFISGEQ